MPASSVPRAIVPVIDVVVGEEKYEIDVLPTLCPRCRKSAVPKVLGNGTVFIDPEEGWEHTLDVPVRCPRCKLGYVVEYVAYPDQADNLDFTLLSTLPAIEAPITVSDTLASISPQFAEVYDQAAVAEVNGLHEICGAGYRRALEFLVKDYLISQNPDKRTVYIKTALVNCIKDHIGDEKIKAIAERAATGLNDYVHYQAYSRAEIKELRGLINLVWRWMELNEQVRIESDRIASDAAAVPESASS